MTLGEGKVKRRQGWSRGQDSGHEDGVGGALPILEPQSALRGHTLSTRTPYPLLGGDRADIDVAAAGMARGEVLYPIVSTDRVEDGIRARAVPAAGRRLRMYRT